MIKSKVLILINHYIPGYKYGGPIRSIQAIKSKVKNEIDFSVFTLDKDFGDLISYPNVTSNTWDNEIDKTIFYFNGSIFNFCRILISESKNFDVLYLNSFFNPVFSVLIIFFKKLGFVKNEVIIAPRGEFNPGALKIKSFKKKVYLYLARLLKFYKPVTWHATTRVEYEAIQRLFNLDAKICLVEGLSPKETNRKIAINNKEKGKLNLVFLARLSQIKNLDFLLNTLMIVDNHMEINLSIYGPIENIEYWNGCLKIINEIHLTKPNIKINYKGEIDYFDIDVNLTNYDFYILPSLGENFGQSIADAFSVGLPVIISNKTPWRNLQSIGVGWDLDLDKSRFKVVIEECFEMSHQRYSIMQNNCLDYADKFLYNEDLIKKYYNLFSKNC